MVKLASSGQRHFDLKKKSFLFINFLVDFSSCDVGDSFSSSVLSRVRQSDRLDCGDDGDVDDDDRIITIDLGLLGC